jgi:uncharacterized protein YjiS (DUF1127 family)
MPLDVLSFDTKSADTKSAFAPRPSHAAFHPEPPPEPDRGGHWLRKAGSWLLILAVEGFAQYACAMYHWPDATDQGQGDQVPDNAAAPDRQTRTAPRLARVAARRHDARQRAALLGTLSDHLLRDIGVARDQIDGFERDEHYRE